MYFMSDEEKKQLVKNYLPKSRQMEIAEELRGWNWHQPPLAPVYDLRLALYEVANSYCPTNRDFFLRRIDGIKAKPNLAMVRGKVSMEDPITRGLKDEGDKGVDKAYCLFRFWPEMGTSQPPVEAIVDYVLYRHQHCPFIFEEDSFESNMRYLEDIMRRFGANGVLFLHQKWCDAMGFQRRYMELQLQEKDIPWVRSEVDRTVGAAQLMTHLEVHLEVIESSTVNN